MVVVLVLEALERRSCHQKLRMLDVCFVQQKRCELFFALIENEMFDKDYLEQCKMLMGKDVVG